MAILPAMASEGEATRGIPTIQVPSRARPATERRTMGCWFRVGWNHYQVPASLPSVPNRWSWAKGADELRRCRSSTSRCLRRRSLCNCCKQSRFLVDCNTLRDWIYNGYGISSSFKNGCFWHCQSCDLLLSLGDSLDMNEGRVRRR